MRGAFDQDAGADEADLPPWAGLEALAPARQARAPRPARRASGPPPEFDDPAPPEDAPPSPGRRSRRSRVAAARRRRSRRRLVTWGAVAIGIVLLAGAWLYLSGQPATQAGPVTITTLRPGEYRVVPDSCHVLPAAVLATYVGGRPKGVRTFDYPDQSQCGYTYDAKPRFRVLTVTLQAYQPYLGAPGNGSATANARYMFARKRQLFAKPPKHTPQPPAAITPVRGLGTEAFSAVQVYHVDHVTDWVTVVVLYRNVMIQVSLEAQASGGFGPVSVSDLRAGALAAARHLLAAVRTTQAVGS